MPSAIIFSLTPEQVYCNSTPDQVLRSFSEDRFTSRANLKKPLVEVRSIKGLSCRHPNFTYDAPIFILHKILKRTKYIYFFGLIKEEISDIKSITSLDLKSFKYSVFDKVIYSLLSTEVSDRIDLITTQTSLQRLPSAFMELKCQKKFMVWYSTNSKPIYAADDKQREKPNFSGCKDYINEHWVWNREEIQFMKNLGIQNSVAVGPIIFQDKFLEPRSLEKFIITYFDVTPFQDSFGFYSETNTMKVLESILKIADEMHSKYPDKVLIQLKPKRTYHESHSRSYISMVKNAAKNRKILVLPSSVNLYQTVSASDIVLAIPYTSPAILSIELGVESFYVSVGLADWDIAKLTYGISSISEFEELKNLIEKQIEKKFNR